MLSGHEFNSLSEPAIYSWVAVDGWLWERVELMASVSILLSVRFHFGYCPRQLPCLFNRNFIKVITWVWWNELIHMIFTTEALFEVAIESWAEWDLNPRPLNSVQMLWPTELSGYKNCFLSFIIFLITNCNFHLFFSFSYRSDVLFSWTINQFIFQNICRWLLISFFERTQKWLRRMEYTTVFIMAYFLKLVP